QAERRKPRASAEARITDAGRWKFDTARILAQFGRARPRFHRRGAPSGGAPTAPRPPGGGAAERRPGEGAHKGRGAGRPWSRRGSAGAWALKGTRSAGGEGPGRGPLRSPDRIPRVSSRRSPGEEGWHRRVRALEARP